MAEVARRRILNITKAIAAAPFLSTLRPIRVAQSAEGLPVWSIKGLYVEACPCAAICPCQVKGPPTAG